MKLGRVVSEEPFTVQLNFEPRCRATLGSEYYVDEKVSECVVCGAREHLLKKNIVTQQYRKLFPYEILIIIKYYEIAYFS